MSSEPERGKGTLLQTMGAVAWSFFGVRRSTDHEKDWQRLSPVHLIVVGVAGGALFIGVLLLLVKWVVNSGVAT